MKTLLWLDDLRNPQDYPHITKGFYVVWAKTYEEVCVIDLAAFDAVSLDNDLGTKKEGKDVLNLIELDLFNNSSNFTRLECVNIHSHNPAAVDYMYSCRDYLSRKYNIKVTKIRA